MRLSAIDYVQIFVHRINHHHPGHFRSITRCKTANDQTAVGLTHQDVGRTDMQALQRGMQLQSELREGAWLGARITPGVAAAVIATDSSESADARLNERPDNGNVARPTLE